MAAKNNKNQTPLQVAAINRCKANVEVLMNLQACTATYLNQEIQSLQKIGQVDQEIMQLLEARVKELEGMQLASQKKVKPPESSTRFE